MTTDDQFETYQLIYVSGAATPFSPQDLLSLAQFAAERNEQIGITGVLLYENQRFMQILEGDKSAVDEIFEVIRNDPRHYGVFVLSQRPILFRQFPDWSMRLAEPGEISKTRSEIHDRLFATEDCSHLARQFAAETWTLLNAFQYS